MKIQQKARLPDSLEPHPAHLGRHLLVLYVLHECVHCAHSVCVCGLPAAISQASASIHLLADLRIGLAAGIRAELGHEQRTVVGK